MNSSLTNKNVKSSLLGPLKKIQKILDDGNPDNDSSACGKIYEFIATVNSKVSSGKLDPTDGAQFIAVANGIMQALGC